MYGNSLPLCGVNVRDVDKDPFEKELCLANETSAEQHTVSTSPRYVKPKTLDQLEEWMKEKPIPYISNDKFSLGNAIDSGMGLSITIDKRRVFINKTLSILSAYQ